MAIARRRLETPASAGMTIERERNSPFHDSRLGPPFAITTQERLADRWGSVPGLHPEAREFAGYIEPDGASLERDDLRSIRPQIIPL